MDFHGIKNYGNTILGQIYALDSTGIIIMTYLGAPQLVFHPSGTLGINMLLGVVDTSVILDVNGNIGINGYIKGLTAGSQPDHAVNKAQLDAVGGASVGGVEGPPLTYDSTSQLIGLSYSTNDFGLAGNALYIKESGIDHDQLQNTHNLTTDIDHGSVSGKEDDDHPHYKLRQGDLTTSMTPTAAMVQFGYTALVTGNVALPKCSDVGQMLGEITIMNDSTASITVTPDTNDKLFDEYEGVGILSPNTQPGEAITLIVLDDTVNAGRWGIKSTNGGMWLGP